MNAAVRWRATVAGMEWRLGIGPPTACLVPDQRQAIVAVAEIDHHPNVVRARRHAGSAGLMAAYNEFLIMSLDNRLRSTGQE